MKEENITHTHTHTHTHTEELFNPKNVESHGWNKSDTERQMPYDLLHIKSTKVDLTEVESRIVVIRVWEE
jgi:hypothetical protein